MEWPHAFLISVLCLGVAAIVIPWLVPDCRCAALLRLIPALAASGSWIAYENQLRSLAIPGDPLIRVDLMLIVPLLIAAWASTMTALVVLKSRASCTEPGELPGMLRTNMDTGNG